MVNTHVAEIADTVEVATDYRRHRCRGTIRVMRMLLIQLASKMQKDIILQMLKKKGLQDNQTENDVIRYYS